MTWALVSLAACALALWSLVATLRARRAVRQLRELNEVYRDAALFWRGLVVLIVTRDQ